MGNNLATLNFRVVLEQTIRHVEMRQNADVPSLDGSRAAVTAKRPPKWHARSLQLGFWMRQTS